MKFREDYNEYDLEGGCVHANLEVSDVVFDDYEDNLNPLVLLKTLADDKGISKLKKYSFGWAQDKDTEEILNVLIEMNSTSRGYWDELLQCPLYPPVILINGNLCDGAHRCLLAYLQGFNVRGAKFLEIKNEE